MKYYGTDWEEPLNTCEFRPRDRKPNKRIRYIIKKFRLVANWHLRDVPPPRQKIYWEWHQRSPEKQAVWERLHPGGPPCPPRKVRIHPTQNPNFDYLVTCVVPRNPGLTVRGTMEICGGTCSEKQAEAILAELRVLTPAEWAAKKERVQKRRDELMKAIAEQEAISSVEAESAVESGQAGRDPMCPVCGGTMRREESDRWVCDLCCGTSPL